MTYDAQGSGGSCETRIFSERIKSFNDNNKISTDKNDETVCTVII